MTLFLRSAFWQPISATLYRQLHTTLGGSVGTHPDFLAFIAQHADCPAQFWGKPDGQGGWRAGIATWGAYLAGDKEALRRLGIEQRFDFGSPELIFPLHQDTGVTQPKLWLGFRSKFVSALHADQLANVSGRNRGRTVCLAKSVAEMSSQSRRRRAKEVRQFIEAGGAVRPLTDYTAADLAALYAQLYALRWQAPHPQAADLPLLFAGLAPLLMGHVLTLHDVPVAFQLLLKSETTRAYTIEAINGGIDPRHAEFGLGTLLMWLNIQQASTAAAEKGLPLRYSLGRNSSQYKAQWAIETPLLRTVTF